MIYFVKNMTTITSAMVTAITSVASNAMNGIAQIVPVAAPVFGGLVLIGVAMRATKKFTGR